ncbi:MAG: hypothetical protein WAW85_02990 [Gordonia sp. (in: high G+C Gram-positive bacteria)]|uniref:hypothetical protein n=1 Tax=Gordonia sp. (in: high G+C Gram-positive bacteria) TaxID=84139 RepID=UPI003BB4B3B8
MPGGYGPPQPPKKSNPALKVTLGVVAVAVVAALVATIVYFASREKGDDTQAAGVTTPNSTSATTTISSSAPSTSTSSSAGGKFTYTEFDGNWNFRLGDVALTAEWVKGADYNDCASFEEANKLTSLGCQYGSELVWKTENGNLFLTQYIMTMTDAGAASAAIGQFTDDDMKLAPGSYISGFETGKWKDSAEKSFLVVTIATATAGVSADTVSEYLKYRHSDSVGALTFRSI